MADPLLPRVAQPTAYAMQIDRTAAAAGALGLAVALALSYRPRWLTRLRAVRRCAFRRRAVHHAAVVAFSLALLPVVLPVDHVSGHGDADEHESVHVLHCHQTPASCSDLPLVAGPGQFIVADPLLLVPTMLTILMVTSIATLEGVTRKPETRPPVLRGAFA